MSDDGRVFDASGLRGLTPRQWTALKMRVNARAHEERRRVIRQVMCVMRAAMSRVCLPSNARFVSRSHSC